MKFFTVSSLVLFILFIGGCSSQDTSQDDFNIVLITIDALRADHLSCYGYERKTTPNIDRIAEQGILFKNVIAPSSWTVPSMASLFTSVYPSNHRVTESIFYKPAEEKHILSKELTTLTEILKANGYTTFGVSSNVNLDEKRGFKRGFDYFKHLKKLSIAPLVNKSVCLWEDEIKNSNKFFLWVHYIDPHFPYYAKNPWIEQYTTKELILKLNSQKKLSLKKLMPALKQNPRLLASLIAHYDSEINFVDNHIGELIQRFELSKNTFIIITADHGEEFLEHDHLAHGHNLYKETIHIPLIAKLPYNTKKEMVERHVNLVDIMPSILQILNIKQPEQTLGKSFWPKEKLLKTNTFDYSYSELDLENSLKSIITPKWKYIYDYVDKTEYLYHIKSDSCEQNNLVDTKTAQLDKLREHLFQWVSASKQYPKKIRPVQISPEEKEKLKELGYIQ